MTRIFNSRPTPRIVAAAFSLAVLPLVSSAADVRDLAIDRDAPTHLVVALSGPAVQRSDDSGRTWIPAGAGLSGEVSELVNAGANTFFAASKTGLHRSLDGAATWTRVLLFPTYSVAAALSSDQTIYAFTASGLFRSLDRGATWTMGGIDLPAGVFPKLAVDATIASRVYGVSREGVFRSDDAGLHFRTFFPLPNYGMGWVSRPAVDPRRAGALYFSDTNCALGCDSELVGTGFRSKRIYAVSVDDASTIFASTLGEIVRSRDGGASFETVGAEIPFDGGVPLLVSAPRSPLTIAVTSAGEIWATEDRGATWQRRTDPGPLCEAFNETLCLGGRFRVSLKFHPPDSVETPANSIPMTADAGAFWFFSANNVEVVVKVVDGRTFNGRFWVFVASLSDLAYSVTVTDLETGTQRIYTNAAGELMSRSDTSAF